jgi:hypothetical protein
MPIKNACNCRHFLSIEFSDSSREQNPLKNHFLGFDRNQRQTLAHRQLIKVIKATAAVLAYPKFGSQRICAALGFSGIDNLLVSDSGAYAYKHNGSSLD